MPWNTEWIEPKLAFQVVKHKPSSVTEAASVWPYNVYHCYKNNDADHRLTYWYTLGNGLDSWGDPTHVHNFDIRDFPTYDETLSHQQIMQAAIDQDLCTIEDIMIDIQPLNRGTNATQ
jgi:hypothetical protein